MWSGCEDFLAEEIEVGLAGDLFDDGAGDDEVGVGVLPLGAGIVVQRLATPWSRICWRWWAGACWA